MKDVVDGLVLKRISDRLIKTIQGIFESKNLSKEQKKNNM